MTNEEIIKILSEKIIREINRRMENMGETFSEAKETARENSCAGSSVWGIVEKHFYK